MHVYVCLFACMLGREVNKEKKRQTGHPTLRLFLQRGAIQKKKNQYCAMRDAA